MRRAFLALLLANLLYAVWVLLAPRQAADSAPRPVAAPQYPERLLLASEHQPAPAGSGSTRPDVPAAPGAVLVDAPASPQGVPAPVLPAEAAPAATEQALPVAGASMPSAAAPAGTDAASTELACVKIGPLEGVGAERLRRGVGEWVDGARVVQLDVPDRSVYWVHVPPLASDADARAVVQALSAKRIDSFVIRDEPALLHGVSLGVFRDEESARSLRDRMSGIGYPVEIHEERRYRAAEFVVGMVPGEAPGVVPRGLRDAVAAAAPRAAASATPCADIAPDEAPD